MSPLVKSLLKTKAKVSISNAERLKHVNCEYLLVSWLHHIADYTFINWTSNEYLYSTNHNLLSLRISTFLYVLYYFNITYLYGRVSKGLETETNPRIWLAEIDLDRGLDFPI